MPNGVLIFGFPLLRNENNLYLNDLCYRQTIDICKSLLKEVTLAGRCRDVSFKAPGWISVDDVAVRFHCDLPDYGQGGFRGILGVFQLLFKPSVHRKLCKIIELSDFVYTDSTSLIGFAVAQACRKMKVSYMYEMRGDVVLNRTYMIDRFGQMGRFLVLMFDQMFSIIRKHAIAGLYINRDLEQRYPIFSGFSSAITDVQLPDELFGSPRSFNRYAKNFLYIGHLEKVKCVDLILFSLHKISPHLPQDWRLDIVGDGPEESNAKKITKKLGIKENVFFHGRIAWGSALFQMYKQADMLLISSMTESGPRTLLEGMAAGLPIVSTSVGLAPELLEKKFLVEPNNIDKYASTLLRVISDHFLLNEISINNYHRAQAFRQHLLRERREKFFAKAIEISTNKKKMITVKER